MPETLTHAEPSEDLDLYLESTWFLDSDSPEVSSFSARTIGDAVSDIDRAVRLYYAIRDGIRYNPYAMSRERADFRASAIAGAESAFCVPKAILLAATGRAAGIPSRLGFADVRNHLASAQLLERMGTDIFAFHGYTEFFLEGKWVKATPAFNVELCTRFGVLPLEFDGRTDSIFHPHDAGGRRHMEYVRDRGAHADFPFEEMIRVFRETYPRFVPSDQTGGAPPRDEMFNPE
jgi:transglutaminase-like putative cysteine protease